jgi:predicted DNA binding protein
MPRADAASEARGALDPSASVKAHDDRTNLTERQLDVLLHCLRRGYYEIPRRSTLRTLGQELGITATSLSLLLRRAEAKIIRDFGERNGSLDALRAKAGVRKADRPRSGGQGR